MTMLNVFFYIILYSFVGWTVEMVYWFMREGYFINRGFLTGPFCPMYGIGAVLGIVLLDRYRPNGKTVFFAGVAIAAALEQTTSYLLEKLFNLTLWDYSYSKWNINGRLSAKNLLLFGLFGVILIKYIHPMTVKLVEKIPKTALKRFVLIMVVCLSLDFAVTVATVDRINESSREDTSTRLHTLIPARVELVKEIFNYRE